MSPMYDIDFGRNIRRTKDYLDTISLNNIDLMEDWVAEESKFLLLTEEDVNWASIEEPLATMTWTMMMMMMMLLLLFLKRMMVTMMLC